MDLELFNTKKQEFFRYLEVERNLAFHTRRAYAADLNQFSDFWEQLSEDDKKHMSLRHVIERFLVSLYYKKIDKSSIARKLSCFKSFERFLLPQGIKLTLQLTRPRLDKKLPVYFSEQEIMHLLDTVTIEQLPSKRPYRDKAILELMYATGVRCSELVSITLDAIDFNHKTIRIFGKGSKERIVLFGKKAHKRVNDYLEKERRLVSTNNKTLFLNQKNGPLTSRSVQRVFEMFRTFLKVPRPITPHKVRHSFATHLLNRGAPLRIVQELLGHKTLSTTEKYTHISLDQLADTCNKAHPLTSIMKHEHEKNR